MGIYIFLLSVIFALLCVIVLLNHRLTDMIHAEKKQWDRAESNIVTKGMLIRWIRQGCSKQEIEDYLLEHEFRSIAIYGMTDIGRLLYDLLNDSGVTVVYGIDRSKKNPNLRLKTFMPREVPKNLGEDVDAIIVTPIYYFSEIYDTMRQQIGDEVPILGLDEILYEIEGEI